MDCVFYILGVTARAAREKIRALMLSGVDCVMLGKRRRIDLKDTCFVLSKKKCFLKNLPGVFVFFSIVA